MIDLNELAKEGWEDRLMYSFLPQQYAAENIKDFLEGKKGIVPTRKLLPLGRFWNGLAIVDIASVVKYGPVCYLRGKLSDVNNNSGLEVRLDDELGVKGLSNLKRRELKEGMFLRDARIVYRPEDGAKWLVNYNSIGEIHIPIENHLRRIPSYQLSTA